MNEEKIEKLIQKKIPVSGDAKYARFKLRGPLVHLRNGNGDKYGILHTNPETMKTRAYTVNTKTILED